MSTEVVMPQMGESLSEGTVTKWLKKVGERVQRDEPLFEISTDKVDTEIPAPASGVLEKILVQEGETVAVDGTPGVIRTPDLRIRNPLLYPTELQAHELETVRSHRLARLSDLPNDPERPDCPSWIPAGASFRNASIPLGAHVPRARDPNRSGAPSRTLETS